MPGGGGEQGGGCMGMCVFRWYTTGDVKQEGIGNMMGLHTQRNSI